MTFKLPIALIVRDRCYSVFLNSRFKQFIDMFGARPSGSKVLEEAIDHMIDLALENGLSGVTTEDVNVSSLLVSGLLINLNC